VEKEIILLIVAGVIGYLAKLAYDWKKKSSTKREIKKTLIAELIETKIILALNALFIDRKYGTCDRNMLLWTREQISKMKESETKKKMTQILSTFAKESDEDIEKRTKIYSHRSIKERGIGVDIKKCELPYLSSQFEKISLFGSDVQRLLIDIKKQVGFLNGEIDNSKKFLDRTFTLTGDNHERNLLNLEDSNKQVGQIAKKIVNLIEVVIPKL